MIKLLPTLRACTMGIGAALFLGSCNLDQFPDLNNSYLPNYEGNIALLLVNDTLSFGDFLEENVTDTTIYSISDQQQILFSYDINSNFSTGDEFVKLKDFNNRSNVESPVNFPFVAPLDTVIAFTQQLTFNFPTTGDELLDSMFFNSGRFELILESTFTNTINYEFSTDGFKRTGTLDTLVIESSIDPSVSTRDIQSFDLDGYTASLVSVSDSNRFIVNLDVEIILEAGQALTGSEFIKVDMNILDPGFDYVFGDFGKDTFNIQQVRKKLKFFEDIGGTGLYFESPRIEFNIINGFGLPVAVDFDGAYFTYPEGPIQYLEGAIADNPSLITASSVENYGTTSITSIVIDNSNSNFRELLAGSPSEIVLSPKGYTNPNEGDRNWISSQSTIDFNAKVTIPFSVRMSEFEYESETELDDLSSLEGTEELSLLINTVNELPFSGSLDLYMVDENGVKIDSLLGQVLFVSPTSFDSQGKVSEPSQNRTEIKLTKDNIDALINSSTLTTIIKVDSYNASNEEFVEVFADYDLQIKLGISGAVSLDLNGN